MITAWLPTEKGLQRVDAGVDNVPADAVWIDAVDITREEESFLEKHLCLEMPTRAEMQEIEASSRLYREGNAAYMTSTMLIKTETDSPETTAVTFILTPKVLVTLRYAEPWSFRVFASRAAKCGAHNADLTFIALLETTVERLADLLELVSLELENISQQTFKLRQVGREIDLQRSLIKIGRCGNIAGKVRESLVDKGRMVIFAEQAAAEALCAEGRARMNAVRRDIQSLSDHASHTFGKIQFLLDATLGLISIDQNRIIKLFSIAAVIFLPPTLVASIYGMNYTLWPHNDSPWGFPFAMALMCMSVGLTLWYFRRQRWL
ncbi:MAG: magnesium transporter CorA family protein [Planctomycetes bacterium]|nr:magnesium transporter CorA family protein [Planctomycetota bacterium]